MFISNGLCTTHITVTEKAGYLTPPTNVNGEPTPVNQHMGYRRRQKQQDLPGEMGRAPKSPLLRTQLATCRRANKGETTKVVPHSRHTSTKQRLDDSEVNGMQGVGVNVVTCRIQASSIGVMFNSSRRTGVGTLFHTRNMTQHREIGRMKRQMPYGQWPPKCVEFTRVRPGGYNTSPARMWPYCERSVPSSSPGRCNVSDGANSLQRPGFELGTIWVPRENPNQLASCRIR
jgi:hypothetical protein